MFSIPHTRLTVALVGLYLSMPLLAQEESVEKLVLTWNEQRLSGADGRLASFDWVASAGSNVLSLGIEQAELLDTRWSVAHAGAARRLQNGASVSATFAAGPASTNRRSYDYRKAILGGSMPIAPRWTADLQQTFIDIEPLRGRLLTAGATWFDGRGRSMAGSFTRSIGGNLDEQTASVRFDRRLGRPYLAVGAALGRSNNSLLLNIPKAEALEQRLRQIFVSTTFPLDGTELTLSLDGTKIGDQRRFGLSIIANLPVR